MAVKRIVSTEFWNDPKVVDLFSPEDKYFMLYILTNPHTTQLGIYRLNQKIAAFELGYSVEAVKVLIERFETKYNLIFYNNETQEIAIKNYLKHSIVKGGKPVEDLLVKEIGLVKDRSLIDKVFKCLSAELNLNETIKNIINQKQNDNDNDNEESYHDSYNDSYNDSSKISKCSRFTPPTLEEVSNYCKERNNGVDPQRFIDYNQSKGWVVGKVKMKDWKAAVRTWEKKEQPKGVSKEREQTFAEITRRDVANRPKVEYDDDEIL